MTRDLRPAKALAREDLAPSHPGRLLVESLPDFMDDRAFDAVLPAVVRALRTRTEA